MSRHDYLISADKDVTERAVKCSRVNKITYHDLRGNAWHQTIACAATTNDIEFISAATTVNAPFLIVGVVGSYVSIAGHSRAWIVSLNYDLFGVEDVT